MAPHSVDYSHHPPPTSPISPRRPPRPESWSGYGSLIGTHSRSVSGSISGSWTGSRPVLDSEPERQYPSSPPPILSPSHLRQSSLRVRPSPDRPSLAALPDEVLVQVFQAVARLSKSSLCSVSRLNKRYHALADSLLYETIHFLTPELHLIFSQSLSRRPRRGSAIREVKLAYPASELSQWIVDGHAPVHGAWHNRYDSLSRTISTMSNLETLDLAVPDTLLAGVGKLFDGPFDLACLTTCTLYYQTSDGDYWDLRGNIHIFSHPSLETLVIKNARLSDPAFDCIEQPHETALNKLHMIECDINDDALCDVMAFPKNLTEFVLTQTEHDAADLDQSSDRFEHYILALQTAAHSLETITIDFPSLGGHKALRMRKFEALKTLRMNWDYQLFGKSCAKPRLHSVGLPPALETLEFFNPLGMDDEVTDLLEYTVENLSVNAQHLKSLVVVEPDEGEIPAQIVSACKLQPQLKLDIIGSFDIDDTIDEEEEDIDIESR